MITVLSKKGKEQTHTVRIMPISSARTPLLTRQDPADVGIIAGSA
jgi:hypothetical protein